METLKPLNITSHARLLSAGKHSSAFVSMDLIALVISSEWNHMGFVLLCNTLRAIGQLFLLSEVSNSPSHVVTAVV